MPRLKRIFWGFVVPLVVAFLVLGIFITATIPFHGDKDIVPVLMFISALLSLSYIIIHIIISFFLKSNIATIILSFGLSYFTIGQIFKIQHYPGATFLNYLGIGLILIGSVLILFFHQRKSSDSV